MANFLVIVDPSASRRRAFVREMEPTLALVQGLRVARLETGDLSAVWAASERAPVSTHTETDAAAIVWGHALAGAERVTADRVAREWTQSAAPSPFDGYFAAATFGRGRLTVGTDLLGLFPVYYAASGDVCIVSATPDVFRAHPLFPAALDRGGLVGLLLVRAPLDGRTLLRGVARLGAGNALVWQPGTAPNEILQYRIPVAEPGDDSAFAADVDALDTALEDAVGRHSAHGSPQGIFLSGGRDSRMLAGYLARRHLPLHALTLGEAGDFEVECARPVAATLGARHDLATVDGAEYPALAEIQANREHLIGGFSNVYMWGITEPLRRLPPTLVTGYLTDSIITGKSLTPNLHDFDVILPKLVMRSFSPAQLERLLRADFHDEVGETVQRLRSAFERTAPPTLQRAWQFQLAHSERCHVGVIPWRLAFGSWPVLPILDRRVLDTVGRIPAPSLANRRAQDEILRQRFPRLARLPHVAANGEVADPLLPPVTVRVSRAVQRVTRTFLPQRTSEPSSRGDRERRYNYRMYDFNSPGWRAIRERAEPDRMRLADLFDMDELRSFLPPPAETLVVSHGIFDVVGRKLLIGLMLWAREHLS